MRFLGCSVILRNLIQNPAMMTQEAAAVSELRFLGVRGGTQGQDSFSRVVDGGTEGTSFTAIPLLEQIPFTISTA